MNFSTIPHFKTEKESFKLSSQIQTIDLGLLRKDSTTSFDTLLKKEISAPVQERQPRTGEKSARSAVDTNNKETKTNEVKETTKIIPNDKPEQKVEKTNSTDKQTEQPDKANVSGETQETKKVPIEKENKKQKESNQGKEALPLFQDVIVNENKQARVAKVKDDAPKNTSQKAGIEAELKTQKEIAILSKEARLAPAKNIKINKGSVKELIMAFEKSQGETKISKIKLGETKAGVKVSNKVLDNRSLQSAALHVSRETLDQSQSTLNHNFTQGVMKNLHSVLMNKGSDMGSSTSSNKEQGEQSSLQNFNNLNQTQITKTILGKTIELPQLKAPLNQQFDAMLNRAKIIIRDKDNARLTAQLYPRELGKVSLRLTLIDGSLQGRFFVENEQVQKELLARLDQISQDMKADGFEVSEFSVDVQQNGNETFAQNQPLPQKQFGQAKVDSYMVQDTTDGDGGQYA